MPLRADEPGVGVLFNPALTEFMDEHAESLDYLAVIPDRSWVDHGPDARPRLLACFRA